MVTCCIGGVACKDLHGSSRAASLSRRVAAIIAGGDTYGHGQSTPQTATCLSMATSLRRYMKVHG